jgi:hypothetical protein
LKKAFEKMRRMGEGKKIEEVLLDAEYYSHDVMDYLDEEKVRWAIVVDQDEAVKRLIKGIREEEWEPYQTQDGITTDSRDGACNESGEIGISCDRVAMEGKARGSV